MNLMKIFTKKRVIFIAIFTILVLVGKQINFSPLVGEPNQFFTLFQFFGPIAGGFLGPLFGTIAVLFAELIDFLIVGKEGTLSREGVPLLDRSVDQLLYERFGINLNLTSNSQISEQTKQRASRIWKDYQILKYDETSHKVRSGIGKDDLSLLATAIHFAQLGAEVDFASYDFRDAIGPFRNASKEFERDNLKINVLPPFEIESEYFEGSGRHVTAVIMESVLTLLEAAETSNSMYTTVIFEKDVVSGDVKFDAGVDILNRQYNSPLILPEGCKCIDGNYRTVPVLLIESIEDPDFLRMLRKEFIGHQESQGVYKQLLVVEKGNTYNPIFVIILAYFFSEKLYEAFIDYFKLIWWAILLGVLIGGMIDYLIPNIYISKYLSKKEKKTIFYSVIFGFLMSACSHGILAIAIELYKKGASIPSVIAFLLASPWANLPITILLFSFFGTKALLLVVSAIVIAIITGLIYQILERNNKIEQSKNIVKVDESFSIRKDIKKRWKTYKFNSVNNIKVVKGIFRGSWALSKMVVWWILIGMILASFARAFVPNEFFVTYMGATILGLVITLVIATIIEVCSEGSAPISFEIFKQTGAFGNSFTFLMAGVATDYTEIGLIWSNIGKKTAIWLPIITVPQIIVLGYLFNTLL